MKLNRILPAALALLAIAFQAQAQFKDIGYEVGISGGFARINNESAGAKMSGAGEVCMAYPLLIGMGSGKKDSDGDSLTNDIEKHIGTDKKNPDTDGDGLSDGEEYLTYKTDPLNPDTDGDGLADGAEVREYRTDPLKADTDGDGLDDGREITEYKTDPTKADTDGDSLSDGDEVKEHKTDPTKADSDGGSVNDAAEIARGSNPRSAADDVPKIAVEIGRPIVLAGVRFRSNSAQILPESERILNDVYETLRDNTQIVVEIHGYTDNTGRAARNRKLSEERAAAVRQWLVTKGIPAERLAARGFGAENPIAPNDTAENRAKNRRIEFVRVK